MMPVAARTRLRRRRRRRRSRTSTTRGRGRAEAADQEAEHDDATAIHDVSRPRGLPTAMQSSRTDYGPRRRLVIRARRRAAPSLVPGLRHLSPAAVSSPAPAAASRPAGAMPRSSGRRPGDPRVPDLAAVHQPIAQRALEHDPPSRPPAVTRRCLRRRATRCAAGRAHRSLPNGTRGAHRQVVSPRPRAQGAVQNPTSRMPSSRACRSHRPGEGPVGGIRQREAQLAVCAQDSSAPAIQPSACSRPVRHRYGDPALELCVLAGRLHHDGVVGRRGTEQDAVVDEGHGLHRPIEAGTWAAVEAFAGRWRPQRSYDDGCGEPPDRPVPAAAARRRPADASRRRSPCQLYSTDCSAPVKARSFAS
jgi:hypothetical protein